MSEDRRKMVIRTGCAGYYNWKWKNVFYPETLPQSQWLEFYCGHFSTLEINATFYKFPTAKSLQTWYNKSPDDFLFSVKAPKLITHLKKFNECEKEIGEFYSACRDGLQDKLACVLFQLPPSFHYSDEKLELVTASLDPAFKNVIEFRDKSWWTKHVYDSLAKSNITFCSVSHPKLPGTIIANSSTGYIRLHGDPVMFYSDYDTGKLDALQQALMKKTKYKEVFVFFNNTASNSGILNALAFEARQGINPPIL